MDSNHRMASVTKKSICLLILLYLQGCTSINTQSVDAENTVNSTLERAFAGELAPAQVQSSNRSKIDTLTAR